MSPITEGTLATITSYLIHTFTFTKIKTFLAVIVGFFGLAVGGYTVMIKSLLFLVIMDFILGFGLAWKENKLSKEKFKLGLLKLVAYCLTLIVLNHANNVVMGFNILGFGIDDFGVAYLGVNETISNLKKLSKIGVPIPQKLITKLENYKENLEIGKQ